MTCVLLQAFKEEMALADLRREMAELNEVGVCVELGVEHGTGYRRASMRFRLLMGKKYGWRK